MHMVLTSNRWAEPDLGRAIEWCKARRKQGIHCTISFLGGLPQTETQALENQNTYLDTVRVIYEQKLDSSITIKPTILGALLDIDKCSEKMLTIFRAAQAHNVGYEIATESRDLVEFALETAIMISKEGSVITLALQTYLNRTLEDIKIAINNGIKIRLVKGAYVGDIENYVNIQQQFKKLVEVVAENKQPILVGTHDPDIIDWVKKRLISDKKSVELSFLKGLSDITKVELSKQGWNVLEYVPFGEKVDAYENRRLRFLKELERMGKTSAP